MTRELSKAAPRGKIFLSVAALFLPIYARAQSPIDLSGVWKMDPSRSESAHQAVPIGAVTLLVKNTPTEITIETRRAEQAKNSAQTEALTFKTDGSETTATANDGTLIKCTAHWEGSSLITGTTRNIQEATITTRQVYSLNPGGREMTVRKTLTVQHGYQFSGAKNTGTGTDVFVRVPNPRIPERR